MTSIAESGQRTGWRGRLIWIALALSLALNVFFVGGLAWVKMAGGPPPPIERLRVLSHSLDLNNDQNLAFEQFLRVIRLRGRYMRETNQPLLAKIWTEMAKPAPDDEQVARLSAEVNGNRETFQKEATTAFLAFMKTLSPEQRTKLAAFVTEAKDEPTRRLFQIIAP